LPAREASVRAGRIASPHGLDGSVRVADPVPALLELGGEVEVSGRTLRIERRAGTAQRPIIRLAGCSDRTAAEALRGAILTVPRARVPELGEQEWWAADLIGLRVADGQSAIGEVAAVLGLPSCEVLEVERAGRSSLLVPLIGDAVRSVDTEAGLIDVDMQFLGEDVSG